jgi:hypothetical protein
MRDIPPVPLFRPVLQPVLGLTTKRSLCEKANIVLADDRIILSSYAHLLSRVRHS